MKQDEKSPYIELCDFLKVKGIVPTGGQAKILIRACQVVVNNTTETRNKMKLRDGDVVVVKGQTLIVKKEELFENK